MAAHNGNQERVRQLLAEGVSQRNIAKALGIHRSSVQNYKRQLEAKAQKDFLSQGAAPDGIQVTNGTMHVKRNAETGEVEVVQAWPRCRPDDELSALGAVVDGLCERVQGKARVKMRKAKKTDSDKLLGQLAIYDPHVGMFAQEKYTRSADYNCDIAADLMTRAAATLCRRFDRPHEIVVIFGGDILHMDSRDCKTSSSSSNHVLDVDTRYQRVVGYAIAACTEVVEIAAEHAKRVRVVITPGNHDWHACVWLSQVLRAYYSRCKHVVIDEQQSPRKSLVWGSNLLIWSHGDKVRFNKWPMIIAAEFAKEWGQTRHRYLQLGHVHHKKAIAPVTIEEQAGLHVEHLEALCPSDAWHAEAGYVGSQRGASGFEYHKHAGRVSRFYYNSEL
jgi:transposase-like protein